MNNIEQLFYDEITVGFGITELDMTFSIEPQAVVGIYKVDFLISPNNNKDFSFAVEIDGHEYHKTKEQREHDYNRERYLLAKGIIPIRFTGTEVFLDPEQAAIDAAKIISKTHKKILDMVDHIYRVGVKHGKNGVDIDSEEAKDGAENVEAK